MSYDTNGSLDRALELAKKRCTTFNSLPISHPLMVKFP